jgi:Gpi18-like mannosyltransferase
VSTTAAQLPTTIVGESKLNRWLALLPIFLIALAIRVYWLPEIGFIGDIEHFAVWMQIMEDEGVLRFYDDEYRMGAWDRTYPPLSTFIFHGIRIGYESVYGDMPAERDVKRTPEFIRAMKMLPMIAELLIIVAVYTWLIDRSLLMRILIPGILAIHPGLIITTTWWGQNEAIYTMFLVLALLALNRDRPLLAWILFALAIMVKQPAVFLGPLLLVLTFRRYGLRTTAISMVSAGALCLAMFAPFMTATPPDVVLAPYLKASDAFPYFSNNAYNFWHGVATIEKGAYVPFEDRAYRDNRMLFDLITVKQASLIMFGSYILLIMVLAWKHHAQRHEFILAAALFFGLFTLPTQVHERYLYPAAVFLVIALAQDRRLWLPALGVALLYPYNLYSVAIWHQTRDIAAIGRMFPTLPTSIANTLLFALTVFMVLRPPNKALIRESN